MTKPSNSLRRSRALALIGCVVAALALPAAAQDKYPSKRLTLVVAAGPGSSTDALARVVGEALSREVGHPVVILNPAGASGLIAINNVVSSAPDGYTMLFQHNAVVIQQVIGPGKFDVRRDVIPVARAMQAPLGVFASNHLPASSMRELVDYVRKNAGKVNFASSGVGGTVHLATERLRMAAGLNMQHVPHPGGSATVMPALMSGDIGVFLNELSYMKPFVVDKRIKALGILAKQRSPLYPDVASMPESGVPELKEFSAPVFFGVYVPAGTPAERVEYLNQSINKGLSDPAVRARLVSLGYDPSDIGGLSPAAFRKMVNDELAGTEKAVRDAKIPISAE